MSNGEAKRWWIDLRPHSNARAQGYSTRHSAWSRPIVRFGVNAVCVMPVEDHERIVAEKDAEINRLTYELDKSRQDHMAKIARQAAEIEALKMTVANNRLDHEWTIVKHLSEAKDTIATQRRVIEKLKTYVQHRVDCICRAGVLQYSDSCDCGLEAIEKGEA